MVNGQLRASSWPRSRLLIEYEPDFVVMNVISYCPDCVAQRQLSVHVVGESHGATGLALFSKLYLGLSTYVGCESVQPELESQSLAELASKAIAN